MRPKEPQNRGAHDLFRSRLDQIFDMGHPLAKRTRVIADRGYRGHNAPSTHPFKVSVAGQIRRVTYAIKRELRRSPAVEPVISHLKQDHKMGENFRAHAAGDAIHAILAAVGYNFRRILAGLKLLCAWFVLLVTAK